MDIAAICPRKEWLTEFKQCWPDLEKLSQWHQKFTPWIDKSTLDQYLNQYAKQIQMQQQQQKQTQSMMSEEDDIQEQTLSQKFKNQF